MYLFCWLHSFLRPPYSKCFLREKIINNLKRWFCFYIISQHSLFHMVAPPPHTHTHTHARTQSLTHSLTHSHTPDFNFLCGSSFYFTLKCTQNFSVFTWAPYLLILILKWKVTKKKFTENMLQIHLIMAKANTTTTGKKPMTMSWKTAPHILSSPAVHNIHQ